jgi:PhoPQ-activated pathogenicity-related protein
MDEPRTAVMMGIIDPFSYLDRLTQIPKYIVVTSDDEFMSIDWTQIYYDKLGGEKHLLIVSNAEHEMTTGMYTIVSSVSAFTRSIAAGHGSD